MKNILHLTSIAILGNIILAPNIYCANPPTENPPVNASLKALDTSTEAEGVREGTSKLVMVDSVVGGREAELTVTLHEGAFATGYPKWTGINVANGSLVANFKDSNDKTISVLYDAHGSGDQIEIDLVHPASQSIEFDLTENGKLSSVVNGINTFLSKFKGGKKLEAGAAVSIKWGRVDKYNDGSQFGIGIEASGSLSATLPEMDADFDIPTAIGDIELEIELEEAGLTGSLGGSYDESKASPGSLTGGLSLGATITADIGPEWGIDDFAEIDLEVGLTSRLEVKADFSYNNKQIFVEPEIGVTKTEVFIHGTVTFFSAEIEILNVTKEIEALKYSWPPENPILLYTFE